MQMSRGRCGGCSQRITQLHQLFLRKPFTSTSPPPLPHSSSSSLFAPHPKSTLSSFLHSSPIFHPSAARIGAFRFFSSKSPNLGFNAKKVFDKPTAALTSAFSRYREAIVLQLEAFFKRNQLFLLGAAGVVFCALLWRILFGVANTFVVLSEGMAKYGFLALSSAIVSFTSLYIRSNPPQRAFTSTTPSDSRSRNDSQPPLNLLFRFTFSSSISPSVPLLVSSSHSEPVETKIRQNAGIGKIENTSFGSSSAAVGNAGNGIFGLSSLATSANSQSQTQGFVFGTISGSTIGTLAPSATGGFATSTQSHFNSEPVCGIWFICTIPVVWVDWKFIAPSSITLEQKHKATYRAVADIAIPRGHSTSNLSSSVHHLTSIFNSPPPCRSRNRHSLIRQPGDFQIGNLSLFLLSLFE